MPRALAVGLFVGGRGSRFGGIRKGNLRLPSGPRLIERLASIARSVLPNAPVVLVGRSDGYDDLGLETLPDSPAGIGPLGGLRALLEFARATGRDGALVLACDLPFVTRELLERLECDDPEASALAPRENGRWHALAARYAVAALPVVEAAIAAHEHSLQGIFARLGEGARALSVAGDELAALKDWDSPEDLAS